MHDWSFEIEIFRTCYLITTRSLAHCTINVMMYRSNELIAHLILVVIPWGNEPSIIMPRRLVGCKGLKTRCGNKQSKYSLLLL
jgi:hypothetical protein